MTRALHRLQEDLRATVWLRPKPGLVYRGPSEFVLEHGLVEQQVLLSRAPGAPRSCYGNAIIIAAMGQVGGFDSVYVEGYALAPSLEVVQHAWVRLAGVGAVEVTWPVPGAAYIGVSFSLERADDATWNGDATVLDDYNRGWPLLQQRWQGEPAGAVWPVSPRLELIRSAVSRPSGKVGDE